jgi:prepilin-type N-terminal cleavage/methylation domain-containing protein
MRRGFTLIELIAVIVVLAILAGVAIPRYIDYSVRAAASADAATLKVLSRAVLAYHRDTSQWPADELWSTTPAVLQPYLSSQAFAQTPALGGSWDYNNWIAAGWTPPVNIAMMPPFATTFPADRLTRLDATIDDGNLATGSFVQAWFGATWAIQQP